MMRITIDTTEAFHLRRCSIKGCARTPAYRHHKGCDNFIGKFNRVVRARYNLFLDCVDVCDYHHMVIHFMYGPIIRAWTDFSFDGALKLRAKLVEYCDKILAGKVKLRKPSKAFRREWAQRRRRWLRRQAYLKSLE